MMLNHIISLSKWNYCIHQQLLAFFHWHRTELEEAGEVTPIGATVGNDTPPKKWSNSRWDLWGHSWPKMIVTVAAGRSMDRVYHNFWQALVDPIAGTSNYFEQHLFSLILSTSFYHHSTPRPVKWKLAKLRCPPGRKHTMPAASYSTSQFFPSNRILLDSNFQRKDSSFQLPTKRCAWTDTCLHWKCPF